MDLLEMSETMQDEAWEQSQNFSPASTAFEAYMNLLSVLAVQPWLKENCKATCSDVQSYWELVNGTAITINQTRLVLIPSEAIDLSEIRVPQEWVDIPSWAGDYYLAVQVNAENGLVKVWGYTTHLQLKQQGNYNGSDRTYSLDYADVLRDLNVLSVTRELCPDAVTKSEIEPLPSLSEQQANLLIEQLSKHQFFPGRALSFESWGALLENDEWREMLVRSRNLQSSK